MRFLSRIACFFILLLSSLPILAKLDVDHGCFFSGRIKILSANAYYTLNHTDVSGYSFFPAKLFAGKTFPIFLNCHTFDISPEETKVSHYPAFYLLTKEQKIAQGYSLVSQTPLSKEYEFAINGNAVLVSRYTVYKPFILYKKIVGSCDLFFELRDDYLSVYVKSNDADKVACYWDPAEKNIVIKAK